MEWKIWRVALRSITSWETRRRITYFELYTSKKVLEAVRNRRPHKIAKTWPLLPCPQDVCIGHTPPPNPHPLSVRTHHKFRKIRRFLRQTVRTFAFEESSCPQNVRTGQTPSPWLRTFFMDGPLFKLVPPLLVVDEKTLTGL